MTVLHLAVRPPAGRADFDSLLRIALLAELGRFDFLVLPDESDLADPVTTLAALAGVTQRLGLVATVDPTVRQPFETARQLATLDHVSGGRAGWSLAAPSDEFVSVVHAFWDSWAPGAVVADRAAGTYVDPTRIHEVRHRGARFDIRGVATLPAGRQGHPPLLHSDPQGQEANGHTVFRTTTARELIDVPMGGRVIVTPDSVDELDDVVHRVVPLLQRRGIVRTDYTGHTLREHLGL